jgi:hypothetical protein
VRPRRTSCSYLETSPFMNLFVERLIRAAKLDPSLYEEVEADRTALSQAMGVVILSSVATGIGLLPLVGLEGLLLGTGLALVSWYVWAYLIYLIGTKLLPEPGTHATIRELLSTIGFASAPGIVRVLAFDPSFAPAVMLVASAWMLVAMIIAVRQALDYQSTLRAVVVCLIGWLVQGVVAGIVFKMYSPLARADA